MSADERAGGPKTDVVGTEDLSDVLAGHLGATVETSDTTDFREAYLVPDPDPESARYLLLLLSTAGELLHAATFDVDELEATSAAADR